MTTQLYAFGLIPLQQGVNSIDINNDGLMDYAFLAQFDDNKSHPSNSITFYIQKPEGGYSLMPSIVDQEFPYFSLSLSGSDVMVSGFTLIHKQGKVLFTTADKSIISAYDKHKINYTFYEFIEDDDHPGVPLYRWRKITSASSTGTYIAVNESYSELEEILLEIVH